MIQTKVSPSSAASWFRSHRLLSRIIVLTGTLLSTAGCGGGSGSDGTPGGSAETGTVVVDGSSTVFRISKAAQEAYAGGHPDVTVVVDNHGTGGGFSRYNQGEVDIVDASRDAKPDELEKAKSLGFDWTRFIVGYDGITIVANPKNDFVKSITVEQLRKLWAPGSKVKTWKDLEPTWPDRKIVLYSPDHDSGTFEFFTEAIIDKTKTQREDVQQSSDDNILVNGVSGDPDALGYFGYAYYVANQSKLRAIPVQKDAGSVPVLPSPETILSKAYSPLSRPLFIFVKNASMARPEVKAFVNYYVQNIKALADKGGYVSPTPEDMAANAEGLKSAEAAGTAAVARSAASASGTPTPASR
ncbi:MAG: PstS family phosphate ABC transporter substrate-binding protein [Isosphaeraceae bacterium]